MSQCCPTNEPAAPVITCVRHRIQCDGQGITTLVAFYGCPLRCRWCLNPFSFDPAVRRTVMTPQELYDRVKIDDLYFLATGGGVTFGGGEPLLYPDFLAAFRKIAPESWHICAETSLAVPWENVEKAADSIDVFYVDCKDANPEIYHSYTGGDNQRMIDNLRKLLTLVCPQRIILRIPQIPEYNTAEDQRNSRRFFENMGITQFDMFSYQLPKTVHE